MKQSITLIEEEKFMRYQKLAMNGGAEAGIALVAKHTAHGGGVWRRLVQKVYRYGLFSRLQKRWRIGLFVLAQEEEAMKNEGVPVVIIMVMFSNISTYS